MITLYIIIVSQRNFGVTTIPEVLLSPRSLGKVDMKKRPVKVELTESVLRSGCTVELIDVHMNCWCLSTTQTIHICWGDLGDPKWFLAIRNISGGCVL